MFSSGFPTRLLCSSVGETRLICDCGQEVSENTKVVIEHNYLRQGPPVPGLRTANGPRPVRGPAAEQEVSGGWWAGW